MDKQSEMSSSEDNIVSLSDAWLNREGIFDSEVEKMKHEFRGKLAELEYNKSMESMKLDALTQELILCKLQRDYQNEGLKELEEYLEISTEISNMTAIVMSGDPGMDSKDSNKAFAELQEARKQLAAADSRIKAMEEDANGLKLKMNKNEKSGQNASKYRDELLKQIAGLKRQLSSCQASISDLKVKSAVDMSRIDEEYYERLSTKEEQLSIARRDIEKLRALVAKLEGVMTDKTKKTRETANSEAAVALKSRGDGNGYQMEPEREGRAKRKTREGKLAVSDDESDEDFSPQPSNFRQTRRASKLRTEDKGKENVSPAVKSSQAASGGKLSAGKNIKSTGSGPGTSVTTKSGSEMTNSGKSGQSLGKRVLAAQKPQLKDLLRGVFSSGSS